MTDATVSDLSYADTLWKAADVLRGHVEMRERCGSRMVALCNDSNGMFVQSKKFTEVREHTQEDNSVYEQKCNTVRREHTNVGIHRIESNHGLAPNATCLRGAHRDSNANFLLAVPPHGTPTMPCPSPSFRTLLARGQK